MYDNLIKKNINHFGREGVILHSKSNDYYNINKVKLDDIKMFYELLKSDEFPNNNLNKKTLLSCCLYYLTKVDNKYKTEFVDDIIQKLSTSDPINDTNLILIYNIIEYDQRYLNTHKKKNMFLLNYLERFSGHKKTVENFLLYKYYRGLLKFYLDKTDEAYKEYLEIITGIEDYVRQKTSYINFIKLQNDLLKVQIDINRNIVNEYWEQYLFMKELFDQVKSENVILANKLGLNLFNILCRLKKYDECIPLLSQMKKILNDKIYSGHNLKSSIDYSLAIFSRMAYIGTIIGDKETVIEARRKLVQILETIKNDKNNPKLVSLYNAYNLCVSILNIYLGIYDNQLKEKAITFKQSFIPNGGFILNFENRDFTLINLNSINNMDPFLNKFTKEIIDLYESKLKKNISLSSDQFMGYLVNIHNNISRLSESYCTDDSAEKRKDYINKINEYHGIIFTYVKVKIGNEHLLECDFVKSLLVDIQQACVSANFGGRHLDKVKSLIIMFDQLKKELRINEKTTSYELINKIKGDYWFKTGDYISAVSYYQKTIEMMKDNNPKKPIVFFNLGCAYYLCRKKKNAIDNLNLCINAYRTFEYEQKTFDVLTRREPINKKIKKVKRLLSLIENKQN